jgi:hypothetical protein
MILFVRQKLLGDATVNVEIENFYELMVVNGDFLSFAKSICESASGKRVINMREIERNY